MNSVEDILSISFNERTGNQMKSILLAGRPQPLFSWTPDSPKEADYLFLKISYARCEWLTTCPKRASVFCWPCLLFGVEDSIQTLTNHERDFELHSATPRHGMGVKVLKETEAMLNRSPTPLRKYLNCSDVEPRCLFNINLKPCTSVEKELRKLNLYLFGIQYEVVESEDPFKRNPVMHMEFEYEDSDDDEDENVTHFQNYLTENYLKPYEEWFDLEQLLDNYALNGCGVFSDRRKFHDDLIRAIRAEMFEEIRGEVNVAPFVTVCFAELSGYRRSLRDIDRELTFFTIYLRYVHRGTLVQRYVGYLQQDEGQFSIKRLMAHLRRVVDEFALEDKLVSVSVDSTAIQLEELASHLAKVYPKTILTDSANLISFIGSQLWSTSDKCGTFMEQLTSLSLYFCEQKYNSPSRPTHFPIPSFVKTCSRVKAKRAKLIASFQKESAQCRYWRQEEDKLKTKTYAFWRFLRDFSQIFLMPFFEYYLVDLEDLEEDLKENSHDWNTCTRLIEEFGQRITDFTRDNFDTFWNESVTSFRSVKSIRLNKKSYDYDELLDIYYTFDWYTKAKLDLGSTEVKESYAKLMDDTVQAILSSINFRYSNTTRTRCFSLVDLESTLNQEINFSKFITQLECLRESFPGLIDEENLKGELSSILGEGFMKKTDLASLLHSVVSCQLTSHYPHFARLATLALTIPSPFTTLVKPKQCPLEKSIELFYNQKFYHLRTDDEFHLRCDDLYCQKLLGEDSFRIRVIDRFYKIHRGEEKLEFDLPIKVEESEELQVSSNNSQ